MTRAWLSRGWLSGLTCTLFACSDGAPPTAPAIGDVFPALAISDGAHGGNEHFYFLPPLVPPPRHSGVFDAGLQPTVIVCRLPACADEVIRFSVGSGRHALEVTGGAYRVLWHTGATGLALGARYQVRVLVGTLQLGTLDFEVVPKRGAPAATAAGVMALREGHPLLIRFRIEHGAIPPRSSSTIAFVRLIGGRDRQIWVVEADDGAPRLLGEGGMATWSPDGAKIAFQTARDGNQEIYVMNADGSGATRLTNDAALDDHFAWSPDGARIAFNRWPQGDGSADIVVMNADGSNAMQVTSDLGEENQPAWSPDGSQLAFYRSEPTRIELIRPDGTGATVLPTPWDALFPRWSPDGTQLLFQCQQPLPQTDICLMGADGSNPHQLTSDGGTVSDGEAAWSPDGRRIVFTVFQPGNTEIFVMNADGSEPKNLTNSAGNDANPVWSPDGRRIAFVSDRDGNSEVYVMNDDGTDQRNVTNSPEYDSDPAWSP